MTEDEQRKAFEKWAATVGYPVNKMGQHYGNVYVADATYHAWRGWKAAAERAAGEG